MRSQGLFLLAVLALPVEHAPAFAQAGCLSKFLNDERPNKRDIYERCQEDEYAHRLGKYFCFVDNAGGILYGKKESNPHETDFSKIYIGRVKVLEDKFFIIISKNTYRNVVCPETSLDAEGCQKYMIESKSEVISKDIPYYGTSPFFFSRAGVGTFRLDTDLRFYSAWLLNENQTLYHGKCEKISQ